MAVKYAWYPHGDKIAIVEKKDTESDWTSPSENITNGIKKIICMISLHT